MDSDGEKEEGIRQAREDDGELEGEARAGSG